MMVKRIAVLGSTGSIGQQTLEVIASLGAHYKVVVLTAGSNIQKLTEQVNRLQPELAVLSSEEAAAQLVSNLKHDKTQVEVGQEGQIMAACWPTADLVVMAQVGFSGFEPLVAALKAGKTVALANKESLVVGGELLKRLGLMNKDNLLPIDSEHSAIRQCLGAVEAKHVRRVILTASGGPFLGWKRDALFKATPEQALAHPNWRMGKKITVDSATMMNKGLEVIEAKWLFDLDLDQIEVVIHPQSIAHSMVEFIDGSMIAQMGLPDMRLPIHYALTYPDREKYHFPRFDLSGQTLKFMKPDRESFPCLDLAYQASRCGGTVPACLNGANEVAVSEFLNKRIRFTDIPIVIEKVILSHKVIENPVFSDLVNADSWSRQRAAAVVDDLTGRA